MTEPPPAESPQTRWVLANPYRPRSPPAPHRPFIKKVRETTVVNPGSVGRPKDGEARASYAIWREGKFSLKRVAYERTDLILRLKKYFSPDLASKLERELLYGDRGEPSNNEPEVAGRLR